MFSPTVNAPAMLPIAGNVTVPPPVTVNAPAVLSTALMAAGTLKELPPVLIVPPFASTFTSIVASISPYWAVPLHWIVPPSSTMLAPPPV